jgi:hypothetical protein
MFRTAPDEGWFPAGSRSLPWAGSRSTATSWPAKAPADSALVKALARAHCWFRLLEDGRFGTLAEMADAERSSRSYVCGVLRLTLLAPDVVERILGGSPTAGLVALLKPFSDRVERQRDGSYATDGRMCLHSSPSDEDP